jgi:hypothetical protein
MFIVSIYKTEQNFASEQRGQKKNQRFSAFMDKYSVGVKPVNFLNA